MVLFSDIYRDKSVFITGVTGFKGSWLALWLSSLGARVTGYALRPPSKPNHFDLLDLDIDVYYEDIRDENMLNVAVNESKPDIVFHFAAQSLVRYSYKNPKETFETNVIGTLNLFEACRKSDTVQAILNITSDKCYENREWVWPYRENEAMGGFDPYSASKGCSELLTSSYRNSFFQTAQNDKSSIPMLASCRAGNVIGGGDWADDRLIPDIVRAASRGESADIRSPHAVRPWQHVLEPLSGYLLLGQKLLGKKEGCAEAWNFGPAIGDNKKVVEVLKLMQVQWNAVKYNIDSNGADLHEANLLKLDSSKAKSLLSWDPVWGSARAIDKTAEWYRAYYEKGSVISKQQLQNYIDDAHKSDSVWVEV